LTGALAAMRDPLEIPDVLRAKARLASLSRA